MKKKKNSHSPFVGREKEFNILSGNCSSWEESKPYTPLKEIFTKIFGIKFDDDLKEIDSSLLFASSYFSSLLSSKIKFMEEVEAAPQLQRYFAFN